MEGQDMPSIKEDFLQLSEIVNKGHEIKASDIKIAPGKPVMFLVDGERQMMDAKIVTESDTYVLLENYLDSNARERYERRKSYDISIEFDSTRARVHFYESYAGICVCCRLIPLIPKKMDELLIPHIVKDWITDKGIIMVSGRTNQGKTTTIASIVDYINTHRSEEITILEDPIEFIHSDKKSSIFKRDVGQNSPSYADALKDILRENINTVVIGEIRGSQSMDAAFGLAEAGIKVISSIHADNSVETIERIVNMFPPSDYERIYKRLSWTLNGIVTQWLVPGRKGGRVLACEILTNTDAISNLLRKGEIHQIRPYLDRSTGEELVSLKRYTELLEAKGLI
jgi:twitching motility protein PilT